MYIVLRLLRLGLLYVNKDIVIDYRTACDADVYTFFM